jgi:hypothetical protein
VYERGLAELKAGRIAPALALFNDARAAVPLKTRIGGLATLQV